MLNFEIKKLFKSKFMLICLILSFILSFYAHYRTSYTNYMHDFEKPLPIPGDTYVFLKANQYMLKNPDDLKFKKDFEKFLSFDESPFYLFNEKSQADKKFTIDEISDFERSYDKRDKVGEDLIDKYKLEIDDISKEVFEWEKFEYNHAVKYGHNTKVLPISHYSSNYLRRLILNADVLFGLPFLFVFILICSNYISKDYEEKNIYLLRSQPIKRWKLIISKFLSLLFLSIFYFIYVLLSMLILSKLFGVPITGFREIYKIHTPYLETKYLSAPQVLLRIFYAYLSIITLLVSLIILLANLFIKKDKVFNILISSFALLLIISNSIDYLRSDYNILSFLNYLDAILGKIVRDFREIEQVNFIKIPALNLRGLLIFNSISILVLMGAVYIFDKEVTKKTTVKQTKTSSSSLITFETKKIISRKSFYALLLLVTLMLIPSIVYYTSTEKEKQASFLASRTYYEDDYLIRKERFEDYAKQSEFDENNYNLYK